MAYPSITYGSNAGTNGSGQMILTKPAGAVAGNVFLVTSSTRTSYPTTPPSGWTTIGTVSQSGANPQVQAFYRVCDGTEGASFVFTTTAFQNGSANISLITGADPANPLDVYAGNTASSATATSAPPAVTTQSNETLAVYALHAYNSGVSTLTPPGNVTVLMGSTVVGSYVRALAASNGPAAPGTLTPSAWTVNTPAFWSNMTIAFRPVQAANQPPTAGMTVSKPNASIGDTIIFNSNAADPESGPLSYVWTLTAAPAGSAATLATNGATATLVPDSVGSYTARCVVTDDHNQTVTVTGTVTAAARIRTKLASGTGWTGGTRRSSAGSSWQSDEVFAGAVRLVGKSAGASSYANSLAPALPSGIQAGDVMYAVASSNGVTVSAPAGWTSLRTITSSSARAYAWRKVAAAGETASSFSMTGANGWGVAVYVFRGANPTTPEAFVAAGGGSASRETTLGLLSVPSNGCAAVYVAAQTSTASTDLQAFNVAKTDYSYYTDGNGRFIAGSETNMPAGTIGRSVFWERLGNTAVIGVIIQP